MIADLRATKPISSPSSRGERLEPGNSAEGHASYAYDRATDGQLMSKTAAGDRRAFDEIIIRYGSTAFKIALRIVADQSIAEDIAQEALVRAWAGARSYEASRAKFTTWLYRIVANLCIDHRRRRKFTQLPESYDPVDPSMTALEHLELHERRAALSGAIGTLSERRRNAIAMVYDEGLSHGETARRMGLSQKAVERLVARTVISLRSMLGAA